MAQATAGVVVIGRNEGERLERCLASVRECGWPCVYVDSGSTDGSEDAARRYGALVVALDMSKPFTAARARNAGFAALEAQHPNINMVQFIDGDCVLAPGWLDTARAFLLARDDIAIVCGRRRERHPERSVYNRICDIEWNTPVGEARMCGGDFLARAAAFKSVGGFRDSLIAGEEPDLCLRLSEHGWRVWRLDHEMTLHDAALHSFRQAWRRSVRAGHAFAEVSWLHRDKAFSWHRNVKSTLVWVGLLATSLAGALLDYRALLGALLFTAQAVRIALRNPLDGKPDLAYGALIMSGKCAETVGMLKFAANKLIHRPGTLIEYK